MRRGRRHQEEIDRVLAGCRADDGAALPQARAGVLRSRFLALYGAAEGAGVGRRAR